MQGGHDVQPRLGRPSSYPEASSVIVLSDDIDSTPSQNNFRAPEFDVRLISA